MKDFILWIKNLFREEKDNNIKATATPKKPKSRPYTIFFVGEEMEEEYRKKKISDFSEWLKEKNAKLRNTYKNFLEKHKDENVLKFVELEDSEIGNLLPIIKLWLKEIFIFPSSSINENDKYVLFFNTTLFTKIFGINKGNIFDGRETGVVGKLGDVSWAYQITMIGLSFDYQQKAILKELHSIQLEPDVPRNWKIYNKQELQNEFIENIKKDKKQRVGYLEWKHLFYLETGKAQKQRIKRYEQYSEFRRNMVTFFTKLKDNDIRARYYDAKCILSILDSNRDGCTDDCTAEVFWGAFPYDQNTQKKFQLRIATGCTLFFRRLDNGLVNVFLFPGRSEDDSTVADGIVLKRNLEPENLLNNDEIKNLWKAFMAWTECTMLDGEPNREQKILYNWYRWSCSRVHGGEFVESKAAKCSYQIGKWVITVGFSGALLALVTLLLPKSCATDTPSTKTKKIINVTKQVIYSDTVKTKPIEKESNEKKTRN